MNTPNRSNTGNPVWTPIHPVATSLGTVKYEGKLPELMFTGESFRI